MDLKKLTDEELLQKYKDTVGQKERFDMMQKGVKVASNSAYGFLGNRYSRYYSLKMAEAITLFGQMVIKEVARDVDKRLNEFFKTTDVEYVFYIDTDSVYIELEKVFELYPQIEEPNRVKFIDKFGEKIIRPIFEQTFENIFKKANSMHQLMFMDREVIADTGIWTGKKRYALNVLANESITYYPNAKQKIMGMEAIRSSYPEICRKRLKEALVIMLQKDNDELIQFIANFKKEFMALDVVSISENTGVSGIRKYSDPTTTSGYQPLGTPHHVKAAYGYNNLLKEMSLTGMYETVTDGNKIKLVYLKTPNITGEEKIAYPEKLPKEFDLLDFIDYNKQFEKTFLKPLKTIAEHVGWNTKKTYTLESLMG